MTGSKRGGLRSVEKKGTSKKCISALVAHLVHLEQCVRQATRELSQVTNVSQAAVKALKGFSRCMHTLESSKPIRQKIDFDFLHLFIFLEVN